MLSLGVRTLLRRTVRFSAEGRGGPGVNGYAGNPPVRGLGPFLECSVDCLGEPDPVSGYLLNIKAVDEAVRRRVRPLVERRRAEASEGQIDLGGLLGDSLDELRAALPVHVAGVELGLSPYHALAMTSDDRDNAVIGVRFDFAAAHRLHVPGWSDEANRACFGKCNNPNGHGHNYRLEVRVTVPAARVGAFSIDALEAAVQAAVIDRFDHKHLNLDTEEFADGEGLNPTIENIARVCHGLLAGPVADLGEGVGVRSVRVWETDRTSSEYPA